MSEARISPPGPEPCKPAMSTPSSLASLRAFGEIFAVAEVTLDAEDATACDASILVWDTALAVGADPAGSSDGGCSPGATIHAIVCPTGISAPSAALIPASKPSAGASTSTIALSVSISRRGSPLVTRSPSFLRQAMSLPVSCAISSAGITTLKAIVVYGGKAYYGLQLETPTRSVLALVSIISNTRSLAGFSVSLVVGSGPFTVK